MGTKGGNGGNGSDCLIENIVACKGDDSQCPSSHPKCIKVNSGMSYWTCAKNDSCYVDNCSPMLCKCLSSASRIATPIGDVAVTSLNVGDIVWTVDAAGKRIVRPLVKVSHVSAPNHRVVHLILTDGRTLDVSGPHPTADGRTVGDLQTGDAYDNSIVKSATLIKYSGTATYDILPAGDTGFYFANGILMGSTLK